MAASNGSPSRPGNDPSYPFTIHADQHAVAFEPGGKAVYVGGDGGLSRSTDLSKPTWHWEDVGPRNDHHRVLLRRHPECRLLDRGRGAEDNGTSITFGNRTWYYNNTGDGSYVAVDPRNSSTLFATQTDDKLLLIGNPVPYTKGGGLILPWASAVTPAAPWP